MNPKQWQRAPHRINLGQRRKGQRVAVECEALRPGTRWVEAEGGHDWVVVKQPPELLRVRDSRDVAQR